MPGLPGAQGRGRSCQLGSFRGTRRKGLEILRVPAVSRFLSRGLETPRLSFTTFYNRLLRLDTLPV